MKAAMILAGCGVFDGSEIHEAVILLLTLKQQGYDVDFYTLDEPITQSISHTDQKPLDEKRDLMEMSGRIARGAIHPIDQLNAKEYKLLGMPGGFGVANNLSDFSKKGKECTVHPKIAKVIKEFHHAKKNIIAMCISPMIVAKVLEGSGVKLTPGTSNDFLKILKELGVEGVSCPVDRACLDHKHHIYSVPAYMEEDADPAKIYLSLQQIFEVL